MSYSQSLWRWKRRACR